jgi:hypothetical protein
MIILRYGNNPFDHMPPPVPEGKRLTDEQFETAKRALFRRWPVTSPAAEEALSLARVEALARVIEVSLDGSEEGEPR